MFNVIEVGKVTTVINGGRACHGAAGVANTPADAVCPLCGKKPLRNDAWLFWPLVGLVCTACSQRVSEATPWEPLELWADGRVKTCITRREDAA